MLRWVALTGVIGVLVCGGAVHGQIVIYVDDSAWGANDGSSWTDAYRDLQDGLASAQYGDVICVATGVYTPDRGTGDRGATFQLVNGVILRGGYAGYEAVDPDERDFISYETVLSGDLSADDGPEFVNSYENSYHVVTARNVTRMAVLDGFNIVGGHAVYGTGGGMYNEYYADSTVANCTFYRNAATYGGAMYNQSSSPMLRKCIFRGNVAHHSGGAICNWNESNPGIADCALQANTAYNGAGIYNYDHSSPSLTNSIFQDNMAFAGGAIYNAYGCYPRITNCVFHRNVATWGAGIDNYAQYSDPFPSSLRLVNCTFRENMAYRGGGIYNAFKNPRLFNSILWDNCDSHDCSSQSAQIDFYVTPYPLNFEFCTIQGWTGASGGIANNGLDPLFADDSGRLAPGSPAIDSGDNDVISALYDLDGNPRFVDDPMTEDHGHGSPPIVDRGAYEFQEVCDWEVTPDCDSDGVLNEVDNCPYHANADQDDFDDDGTGDVCDEDIDDDGVTNDVDVCDFSPPAVNIEANGTCPADLDGDCDVDLADFAIWQTNLSGP